MKYQEILNYGSRILKLNNIKSYNLDSELLLSSTLKIDRSKILLNLGKSFKWRTWSYINVFENRMGDWQVVVEDTLGVRHDSLSFSITSSN